MTLFDSVCLESFNRNLSPDHVQIFTSDVIVTHGHIRRNSVFGNVRLKLSNLDDWARMGSFESLTEVRKDIPNAELGFYFVREPNLSAKLADGTSVVLGPGTAGHVDSHESSVRRFHEFTLVLGTPRSLDRIIVDYVSPLVDLLTLTVDYPSGVGSLQISRKGPSVNLWEYMDVGLTSTIARSSLTPRVSSPGTQIVSRAEFNFAATLPLWFDLADRLRGIRGLVFSARYAPNLPIENKFLNAAIAAESLHRVTIPSTRTKVNLKDKESKSWVAHYPVDQQQLIKSRVSQYVNDPSLADRLQGLAVKAGQSFSAIVPDIDSWVKLVKDARNFLTHQEGTSKVQLTLTQLDVLADTVALVVYICMLSDLGYDQTRLDANLLRSFRIKVLREEVRSTLPNLSSSTAQ